MRRLAAVFACVVVSFAAFAFAAPARGFAVSATGNVGAVGAAAADDTTAVCDRSGITVSDGMNAFLDELDKAGTAAGKGDVAAADTTVKHSGTMLADLAGKLRKDTEKAQNPDLRAAVEDFAKELEALGKQLTGVVSLESFTTERLQSLAGRVATLCGQ